MNASCFLDSNVLVYAAAGRGVHERKRTRALDLLEEAEFGLSGQVLQEFFVSVTHKAEKPLSRTDAAEWIARLSLRPVVPINSGLVMLAIRLGERYRISHWDAAIVAAAECLEASILYTEDLNDGQMYGSVKAVNPFAQL